MTDVQKTLLEQQDPKFRRFQAAIIPTVPVENIIGVRSPVLRKIAKQMTWGERTEFILEVPHQYFDENLLHALILSEMKDFKMCVDAVNHFLPFVDNWAVCDQLRPKPFKSNQSKLLSHVIGWLTSENEFTVRFGIEMLMLHYLGEEFRPEYLRWVASIHSDKYYVKMAVAWYFATALAEQPEAALPFIEQSKLVPWVHNKTIQKAVESYRISDEQKEFLRKLRITEQEVN